MVEDTARILLTLLYEFPFFSQQFTGLNNRSGISGWKRRREVTQDQVYF